MATLAQQRLAALSRWFDANSQSRTAPNGRETVLVGRFASVVPWDFTTPPPTDAPLQALLFLASEEQCDGIALWAFDPTDKIDTQRDVSERIEHVLFLAEDGRLPPCVIVGLTDPAEPVADALGRAGMAGVDTASLPVLAVPLYGLADGPRRRLATRLPFAARPHASDPAMPDDRQPSFSGVRDLWP